MFTKCTEFYVLPTNTDLDWHGMKKPIFFKSLKKNIWLNYKFHTTYGICFPKLCLYSSNQFNTN